MTNFDQLHPAVQHHIVNSLGWNSLRELQDLAIPPILEGVIYAETGDGELDIGRLGENATSAFPPLYYVEGLQAAALFYISQAYGLMGANSYFAGTADASAAAIGSAFRAVRRGEVDVATMHLGPLPPISADVILAIGPAKWRSRWAMQAPVGWAKRSSEWRPATRSSTSPYNESSRSSLMANVALTPVFPVFPLTPVFPGRRSGAADGLCKRQWDGPSRQASGGRQPGSQQVRTTNQAEAH